MKLLLLGANGQVGWELQRALAPLGELTALERRTPRARLTAELTDVEGLAATVRALAPHVIVNAAAYTGVDQAESEPKLAYAVNAEAPGVLAREAERLGAWLVHYSTDYVFDGSGHGSWREKDPTHPLNTYGASKLKGETAIRESGCRHLIFRTSWVYAVRGRNFIHTMLRLAAKRETLQVINDQIGTPTSAELIADVTAHALRAALSDATLSGTYHLAAAGETSWWAYARYIIATARERGMRLRADGNDIEPVATEVFPVAAERPRNSRLATARLEEAFSLQMPPWEQGVFRCVAETASQFTVASTDTQ